MTLKLTANQLESWSNTELLYATWEPILQQYLEVRKIDHRDQYLVTTPFYKNLTEGENALFTIFTYFGHVSGSAHDLYFWSVVFYARDRWTKLRDHLSYFHAQELLDIVDDIQTLLRKQDIRTVQLNFSIDLASLEADRKLIDMVERLYDRLKAISPAFQERIGAAIRASQHLFLEVIY